MQRKTREPVQGRKAISGKSRAKKDSNPLDKVLQATDEIVQFARVVAQGMPYLKFARLDPPLEAGLFLRLRNVAILSTALHFEEKTIAVRLGISSETLKKLREHVHYKTLVEAVRERVEGLSEATNITGLAKASEAALGMELLDQALSKTGSREQLAALSELAARSDPKVARQKDTKSNTLILPAEMLAALAAKLHSGEISLSVQQEEAIPIAGSVLGVPKKEIAE